MDSYESYAAALQSDAIRLRKTADLLDEKARLVTTGHMQTGHASLPRIEAIDRELQSLGWQDQPT